MVIHQQPKKSLKNEIWTWKVLCQLHVLTLLAEHNLRTIGPCITIVLPGDSKLFNALNRLIRFSIQKSTQNMLNVVNIKIAKLID